MTAMPSSTPAHSKGIAVDSKIQMPPTCDYCSSDSYSDSPSLDWLREKEVDTPSNCNKKDASSHEWAKTLEIEDAPDVSEDLELGMRSADNAHSTRNRHPADEAHPAGMLAAMPPSQILEPHSQAIANEVTGQVGAIEALDADHAPTSDEMLCSMRCKSCCLQNHRSKKVLLATCTGLMCSNEFFDFRNAEVHSKFKECNKFFSLRELISMQRSLDDAAAL